MKLSLIIPSYQQVQYLRDTLRSAVDQRRVSPDELELIVIDGGSTDGSVDIIREFESHLTYWVSERDGGQTEALRKGFDRATGDVMGWLCSDDMLEPDAVRTVLNYFSANTETRFCYGDGWWIDRRGQMIGKKKEIPFSWFIWRYAYNYIPQPSAFWKSDLYHEVGGLDEKFDLAMDADLFARFAERTKPVHLSQMLSRMRVYPEQKTSRLSVESRREIQLVAQRHGAWSMPVIHLPARLLARMWRVGWKLANGCYW